MKCGRITFCYYYLVKQMTKKKLVFKRKKSRYSIFLNVYILKYQILKTAIDGNK